MSVREPLTPLSTNNMSTPTSKRPIPGSKFVSPSTSRHAHIQTPVGVFTKEHDDAAEKRDRRRSRVLELQRKAGTTGGSPISPADRRRSTPLNGLTANQLSDHYASCIKLSTENKINAKNAFGLHLIDYMSDLLQKKELENFQVASTTLDASAKIYAGRVDFIHSETYKVLTGLGRSEKDKEGVGEGDENTGEGGNEEGNKKKRKARKSRTIETNLKNINVNKFDLEFEVDPMFQITSAAFDEGGVSGLLLNNLQCFDDSQELILDSSTQVSIIDDRNLQPRDCQPIDTGELKALFSKLHMDEKRICPLFEDFRFTEWDGSDTTSIIPKSSSEHAFDVNAEVEPIPEPDEDDFNRDMDVLSFTGGDSDDENHGFDNVESQEEAMSQVLGDNNTAKLVESAFRDLTHGSVGSLMQILASEPSDYSYFDKTLLKSWAGPSHWKLGPLSKDPKNVPKNPKAKKADFTIDYEGEVDLEKPFRKSKATTLTKATLTKHTKTQTTLPEDQHYDADKLFKLFNKPKIMIKRHTASDVGVDEAVENYDYDNANDKDNYCPADAADDDDDDPGFNFTTGSGDYSQEMTQNPSLQDTLFDGTVLAGDKLLAQPYKVAKIDIGYAKTAKKLDVRRLKGSMWRLLTKKDKNTEEEEEAPVQEEENEDSTMNTSWSFQSLLQQLPEKVSTNTAKNLSVPIAFVCLLHLANEKSLKITGEELKDLVICKD